MGAQQFYTWGRGKTAKDAFNQAVSDARYEHGHGGYTGTIAEKFEFVMIKVPEGTDPHEYAEKLVESDDSRIADKWGPAGCIKVSECDFLFFGSASS
jgi:hypothetical protein